MLRIHATAGSRVSLIRCRATGVLGNDRKMAKRAALEYRQKAIRLSYTILRSYQKERTM